MRSSLEVADVFRSHGPAYRESHGQRIPLRHLRAMRAIEVCRTAALGGHVEACDHCGTLRVSYNSCRNRHCPKCQGLAKERWLEDRKKDLLPTGYFHVVFTLPDSLRPLALRNQEVFYHILFRAASETLKTLTQDPKHLGAEVGFIAVLHTWSQTLMDHPHLHCIVTGGGLSPDGTRWVPCKEDFLVPVKALSRLFRGKFLVYLNEARQKGKLKFTGQIDHMQQDKSFNKLLSDLYQQDWVVYCKRPFSNAEAVMDYLGRYTHRVAISNDRVVHMEGDQVTFRYRDRSDNNTVKYMNLHAEEFIRRFLMHVLPDGFMKIRHYGILSNRSRRTKLVVAKTLLGVSHPDSTTDVKETWQDLLTRITGSDPRICPHCGKGRMVLKEVLRPSALSP
jgi:hypothetical protein